MRLDENVSAVVNESMGISACRPTSSVDHTSQSDATRQGVVSSSNITTATTTSAFKRTTTSPPNEWNDTNLIGA